MTRGIPRTGDTFDKRHSEDVAVYWPGKPERTRGQSTHQNEAVGFKTFLNNHIQNDPYVVLYGQGDWICSVAIFTGTFKEPMTGLDEKIIQPTNKKFRIEFCTVAHWKNGEIVQEKLFYDLVGLLKQIGDK